MKIALNTKATPITDAYWPDFEKDMEWYLHTTKNRRLKFLWNLWFWIHYRSWKFVIYQPPIEVLRAIAQEHGLSYYYDLDENCP